MLMEKQYILELQDTVILRNIKIPNENNDILPDIKKRIGKSPVSKQQVFGLAGYYGINLLLEGANEISPNDFQ